MISFRLFYFFVYKHTKFVFTLHEWAALAPVSPSDESRLEKSDQVLCCGVAHQTKKEKIDPYSIYLQKEMVESHHHTYGRKKQ